MKKILHVFIALTVLCSIKINAQTYGLGNTDPAVFTKFKIPDTDLNALWFNTSFSFNSNKSDHTSLYYYGPGYSSNSYSSNLYYSLNPQYYLLKESDNKYLNLRFNLSGSYGHNYSESQNSNAPYISTNKENDYNTNLTLSFSDNEYLNSGNFFYSAGANISVVMSDTKRENNYITTSSSYNGSKTQSYIFSFGVGTGKMRNVTPVVTAVRFQERLKQVNLISRDLSENAIEDLAQQFYRLNYYSQVYDRSAKYFWKGIDNVLAKDGVSLDGLNLYADSYVKEATGEVRFFRQEGMTAGFNAQFNYSNSYSASSSYRSIQEQLYAMGNAYINYSRQMNLNSQLSLNLSLSGGPNILHAPVFKQRYIMNAGAGYSYELTDRLVTTITNNFTLSFTNASVHQKYLTNTLNFLLNYFVEDNVSLNANYQWSYINLMSYSPTNSDRVNKHSIDIGLTYYLQRGLLIN